MGPDINTSGRVKTRPLGVTLSSPDYSGSRVGQSFLVLISVFLAAEVPFRPLGTHRPIRFFELSWLHPVQK